MILHTINYPPNLLIQRTFSDAVFRAPLLHSSLLLLLPQARLSHEA